MGFNNFIGRKNFERNWEKLREEYAAAGMDPAAIEAMYQFDLDVYKSDRRYGEHVQTDCFQDFDGDVDCAADTDVLREKFLDSISIMPQETDSSRRDYWVDEIDSPWLSAALRQLSPQDIELLTLYVFDGYRVTEIAAMQGVSQPTVSKKLKRIGNFLKKFLSMAMD